MFIDFSNPAEPKIEKIESDLPDYSICVTDTKNVSGDLNSEYLMIVSEMKSIATELGKEFLNDVDKDEFEKNIPYKWLTADVLASFISEWVCYAITQWIDGGMKIPVDEIVGTFIYISYHSILELMVPSID